MSFVYWHPQYLLGIETRPDDDVVMCIGRKARNGPCRFKALDTWPSSVYHVLDLMSRIPPEEITRKDLERLASRNLCRAHHSHQASEIAAKWRRTLKTHVEHRSCDPSRQSALIRSLKKDFKALTREVSDLEDMYHETRDKLDSKRDALKGYKVEVNNLKEDLRDTTSKCKNLEVNLQIESMVRQRVENENMALCKELDGVKSLISTLRDELREAQRDNQTLRAQAKNYEEGRSELVETLQELRTEANLTSKREEQLKMELKDRDSAVRRCSGELMEEKSRVSVLQQRISDLELSEHGLHASISGCWWHKLTYLVVDMALYTSW
ncbi:hypothetical protein QQS21_001394 [Conoideocrella luteorostrata]|uniref:Uncharacterized protein n=1 Tax=Conoideocrella luteorostrata TaxID=1105319 RepID=A0AAJ0D0Q6_9HYPO|nr:hypothetical protein QQS21_001394 [Conoideocrella luteorostrata]